MQDDQEYVLANDNGLVVQSKYYQRGYLNALRLVQRQYSLRNRDVPITSTQKRKTQRKDTHPKQTSQDSTNKEKEPTTINHRNNNEPSISTSNKDKDVQRREYSAKEQCENRDTIAK